VGCAARPVAELTGGVLRVRRGGAGVPRVRYADPDRQASLRDLPVVVDGDFVRVELPNAYIWQMLVIDLNPTSGVS
jgi:hypothetical protein